MPVTNEVLLEKIDNLVDRVGKLELSVQELTNQSNKWKGAFGVILAFGGVSGAILTWVLSHIRW